MQGLVTGNSDQKLVVNELLCYCFNHIHNSTALSLTECVCDFYKPQEIWDARQLLWNTYEGILSTCASSRKRVKPTDKATAKPVAEDITNWAAALHNNTTDTLSVGFVAVNLVNIPPCKPEEINVFSLAARVTALEKQLEKRTSAGNTLASNDATEDSVWPRLGAATNSQTNKSPYVLRAPELAVTRPHTTGSTQSATTGPDKSAAPGLLQKKRSERKRRVREATRGAQEVVGTKNDSSVKCSTPVKHIFVHKVDKKTDTPALQAYMQKNKVEPRNIICTSKPEWLKNSFKVTINKEDFGKVFIDSLWPTGVCCREWLTRLPRKTPYDYLDSIQDDASVCDEGNHGGDDNDVSW